MDALALAFYAVFFVVAFGWRTWVQSRRTGDTGLRLHASPGSVQWWAKLAFIAALGAGVAAPLAALAGLEPIEALDRTSIAIIGTVVALTGIGTTVAAQWAMGTSWRIGVDRNERTGLVTTGAFSVARNPIFTAMCLTALGLMLMVPNAIAVTGFVALIAALELQVRLVEEPYLRSIHGQTYAEYAATTGRFVPGLGRDKSQAAPTHVFPATPTRGQR